MVQSLWINKKIRWGVSGVVANWSLSMNKRSLVEHPQQWLLSPGLKEAPVLDLMCSHFVLRPGLFLFL